MDSGKSSGNVQLSCTCIHWPAWASSSASHRAKGSSGSAITNGGPWVASLHTSLLPHHQHVCDVTCPFNRSPPAGSGGVGHIFTQMAVQRGLKVTATASAGNAERVGVWKVYR